MVVCVEQSQVIKIKVSPEAKRIIQSIADKEDMTEQGLAGRIYGWFADQPDIVQKAIIGHIPKELMPDIVPIILRRLAPRKAKDVDHATELKAKPPPAGNARRQTG